MYEAEQQNQKEKHEGDLKKEIKKLQRHRDQIKNWIQLNEIKDKRQLLDARKRIEREMERFKVCEREMKTKAYSKEGLGQAARQDPRDKARQEARDWVNGIVDQLGTQVDEYEFEAEALQGSSRRGRKGGGNQGLLEELEILVERHREHTERLEQVLRGLDNETLSADDVWEVRDLVEDYIERHRESPSEFECREDIYDLILERIQEEGAQGGPGSMSASKGEKEERGAAGDGWDREAQKAAAAAAKAALLGENSPTHQPPQGSSQGLGSKVTQEADPLGGDNGDGLGPGNHAAAFSKAMGGLDDAVPGAAVWQGAGLGAGIGGVGGDLSLGTSPQAGKRPDAAKRRGSGDPAAAEGGDGEGAGAGIFPASAFPGGGGGGRPGPLKHAGLLLSNPSQLPAPLDRAMGSRALQALPQNPAQAPPSYPKSLGAKLQGPSLYEQLDVESLFFAFYFKSGSVQQYLSARELKQQGWRYNMRHGAWFQRQEEPRVVAPDYERGNYVYFDPSLVQKGQGRGFVVRSKEDFTFEYRDLESEV